MNTKTLNYFLILMMLVLIPISGYSQSKRKKKKEPQTTISHETRIQSEQFAEGLKEFYAHNYSVAEDIFRSITSKNPKNDPSFYMLSKIKYEQKDYYVAIEYIKKAVAIDPGNIWYDQFLATLYDQVDDYVNSVIVWERVCKKIDNNEYYLYELAHAYSKLNKLTDVIRIYDKMEEIIGINEELTETKKNIWLYLNNIEKAVGEYEKMIKLYPSEVKNYIAIGNIYFANNLLPKAFQYYKKAEKISPDNTELAFAFIEYYNAVKQPEEREKYILQVFRSSNNIDVLTSMIEKELKEIKRSRDLKKLEAGILYTETFANAQPELGIVWGYLAQLYLLNLDFPKALETSEKAILNQDISYETWDIYITLLNKNQNYSKIASHYEQITELFPTQTSLLHVLGVSLYKNKEYSKAISVMNSCLLYSFDESLNGSIYEQIGDSYKALNNPIEALKHWKLAQKSGNNSIELKEKINSNK